MFKIVYFDRSVDDKRYLNFVPSSFKTYEEALAASVDFSEDSDVTFIVECVGPNVYKIKITI